MGTMIATLLLSAGIGFLVGLVISIGHLMISTLIKRIKEKQRKRVVMNRAKEILRYILEQKQKNEQESDDIKIDDLEKLMGAEGCIEYTINDEGKVDANDINILQADTMEDKLKVLFDQHNGELIIAS